MGLCPRQSADLPRHFGQARRFLCLQDKDTQFSALNDTDCKANVLWFAYEESMESHTSQPRRSDVEN